MVSEPLVLIPSLLSRFRCVLQYSTRLQPQRVPDQISDSAVDLAAVDVSQHTALVFDDFSHIAMDRNPSEPHTLEMLTAQVKVNFDQAQLETGKL